MYRVIKYFTDLHDKDHPYNVGDTFPREGITVTDERLEELSGSENKQKTPLIEKVEEPEGNSTDGEPADGVSEDDTSDETPETDASETPEEPIKKPAVKKAAARKTSKK